MWVLVPPERLRSELSCIFYSLHVCVLLMINNIYYNKNIECLLYTAQARPPTSRDYGHYSMDYDLLSQPQIVDAHSENVKS